MRKIERRESGIAMTIELSDDAPVAAAADLIKAAVDEYGSVRCYWRGELFRFDWIETVEDIATALVRMDA